MFSWSGNSYLKLFCSNFQPNSWFSPIVPLSDKPNTPNHLRCEYFKGIMAKNTNYDTYKLNLSVYTYVFMVREFISAVAFIIFSSHFHLCLYLCLKCLYLCFYGQGIHFWSCFDHIFTPNHCIPPRDPSRTVKPSIFHWR